MNTKRTQIVETACRLMETQGYHATGLNQILLESDAPKGSLYYYFPGGKEELTAAAIACTRRTVAARFEQVFTAEPDAVRAIVGFVRLVAGFVEASGFAAGGPLTAIALEAASTNARLREECNAAYGEWQALIAAKLGAQGVDAARAARLAVMVIAGIEGGIVLSRCAHAVAPLLAVADEMEVLLSTVVADAGATA